MATWSAEDLKIIKETERRMMLKGAARYEKEAKAKRESAARLIREAEQLESEASQNRSVAASIPPMEVSDAQ